MNAKAVLPVACMALLLGTAGVRGQYPPAGSFLPPAGASAGAPAPEGPPPVDANSGIVPDYNIPPPGSNTIGPTGLPLPPGAVPSPWIEYGRPGCCGPLGMDGPITYELYTRAGGNFIFGDGLIAKSVTDGWSVGGGGRTLLFDSPGRSAWVVDLGLLYMNNPGKAVPPRFEYMVTIPSQPATVNNPNPVAESLRVRNAVITGLDRTAFNFSLGKEWFYYDRAFDQNNPAGVNFRWGFDGGGRWGTSHVDLLVVNENGATSYGRQHGVFGSLFGAVHSDVEVPMGSWILFGGIRAEYDHTWSKPLQGQNGKYHTINLLGNFGVRF